jgi:hypothetical protein
MEVEYIMYGFRRTYLSFKVKGSRVLHEEVQWFKWNLNLQVMSNIYCPSVHTINGMYEVHAQIQNSIPYIRDFF